MQLTTIKCKDVKPLISFQAIMAEENLQKSIAESGVIVPPIICNNILCDGHRRIKAAMDCGIQEISCLQIPGNAELLYAELNRHREVSSCEAALIIERLSDENQTRFLETVKISESPQMKYALAFIASEIKSSSFIFANNLPLNIWRELGHLSEAMPFFARRLMQLPGTVGEKRNIASALRQLHRKNALPEDLHGINASEVFNNLQKIAQPRRTGALDKFNQALQNAQIPTGATINIDPTFSQPGMQINISIRRNNLERLEQLQLAVKKIFNEVEEL